jgi:hypothetical protein
MSFIRLRRLAPAALLASTTAALAAPPDPLDAAAPVPPLRHDSVTAHHRPLAEPPVAPWKASNDTVGRIGGWRAYAREAQQGAADPAPATPSDAAPAPRHEHRH